ncbi:MAG: GNAT family N-acetyltransferase [Leptothrix sp. (in: Bacteria)]|jgi:GNAT superfamily N-acetyltransferase|nr:GNAT family N-acetyltransferase [Leptothrix sp. (in: b-proteobacteria)]MBP7522463.1 GNAT family N-acetyltransferase [Leptothrix sp. (in: b-proteobacteria)]
MIRLEPLTGHHDRNGFDCGVEALDVWLKQTALQHQGKGISRSFVAVPADESAVQSWAESGYPVQALSILGFYALTSAFVLTEDLPARQAKRYPRQIPVTRLGRLATRSDMQGQGLGRLLLADAVNRAHTAAQAVGSAGLFVDAKNEAAARFYQRYGFIPSTDQPLKLFLSLW